jgi:pimeloyl-ACP methyl ester carboxylesterase
MLSFRDRQFRAYASLALSLGLISGLGLARAATGNEAAGGATEWVDTAHGRLKALVYAAPSSGKAPVLVIVLHGDGLNPPPSYQYQFAQAVVEGYSAVSPMSAEQQSRLGYPPLGFTDVVTAGILRPGFVDPAGDRSAGSVGSTTGEPQYTAAVVDAVAEAVERLKTERKARKVILVGHSGGAAIAADVMGRHPGLVDGAVLVACGCDPPAWRKRAYAKDHDRKWLETDRSLSPLRFAAAVPTGTHVRMVVGDQDDNAAPVDTTAYANALKSHGVDVEVQIVPGVGHNIMFSAPVFVNLAGLLREFSASPQT